MKEIFGLIFGLFITMVVSLSADLEEWNAFKLKYGKNYVNRTEEELRMEIFLQNKHKIEKHNDQHAHGSVSFKMSINQYSDLTPDDFNARMKGLHSPELLASTHVEYENADYFVGSRHKQKQQHNHHDHDRFKNSVNHLPKSIDWRDEGAVNANKFQKDCGSCWAFSATGVTEGQYFRKTGKLIRLSEQNLIDCIPNCGCEGCNMPQVYRYMQEKGVHTYDSYATYYMAEDEYCQFDSSGAVNITGYKLIPEGDEQKLIEAIANIGPISIQIDGGHDSLMHYSSGIYYEPECSSYSLNHAVLAVGYGTTEDGEDYYIVQNWWGDWGDNDFFLLARNRCNHCGVATKATYPLL